MPPSSLSAKLRTSIVPQSSTAPVPRAPAAGVRSQTERWFLKALRYRWTQSSFTGTLDVFRQVIVPSPWTVCFAGIERRAERVVDDVVGVRGEGGVAVEAASSGGAETGGAGSGGRASRRARRSRQAGDARGRCRAAARRRSRQAKSRARGRRGEGDGAEAGGGDQAHGSATLIQSRPVARPRFGVISSLPMSHADRLAHDRSVLLLRARRSAAAAA